MEISFCFNLINGSRIIRPASVLFYISFLAWYYFKEMSNSLLRFHWTKFEPAKQNVMSNLKSHPIFPLIPQYLHTPIKKRLNHQEEFLVTGLQRQVLIE